ncbi:MAG TPA: hypothetical protein VF121_13610 [Thermoanaerobaculia bacterium]|nr:hypothetical protein [Thermoanaerobaculia bacterium]
MKRTFPAVILAAAACASSPGPADWQDVAVIERNREGEAHLALPTSLPGCEHLGMTRVSIPEGVAGVPPDILDTLKQKAARMGGNTLVLLPGKRILARTLRGSVFRCAGSADEPAETGAADRRDRPLP